MVTVLKSSESEVDRDRSKNDLDLTTGLCRGRWTDISKTHSYSTVRDS